MHSRFKKFTLVSMLAGFAFSVLVAAGTALYLIPQLPSVELLKDYRLQIPLRIYSSDRKLIAEFGEQRRTPIAFEEVPPLFIKAMLAAEDARFESHHGVDPKGLMRAALELATTGSIQSGGSTITMQVARNYLISNEVTFNRKFKEILLALQIERELSKEEILELYFNKIFLGNRAYGFQAAAQVYYGTDINNLDLAQLAMLAALPKAPSTGNPIANPRRAQIRRDWILGRMQELGYIDQATAQHEVTKPVTASYHGLRPEVEASYVAEMVRTELLKQFSAEEVYSSGMKAYTTLRSDLQHAANQALREGLMAYDRRHGYRGPESRYELPEENVAQAALALLDNIPTVGPLLPAIVTAVEAQQLTAMTSFGEIQIPWEGMQWARRYINANAMGPSPKTADEILKVGDQIRVLRKAEEPWQLSQVPGVQGALVALSPQDGAILSLVGGFSFQQSKYNRATQGARQPGSSFKPFIYAAALENGYTAASIINDAPVVFADDALEGVWRPENDGGEFLGPTRLRKALYQSRNMVSIRLLRELSISRTIDHLNRYGFSAHRLSHDLSLALGSKEFTPLEMASGYAAIANGGYRVEPYLISHAEDANGQRIYRAMPKQVCPACETPVTARAEKELTQALNQELAASGDSSPAPTEPQLLAAQHSANMLEEISLEAFEPKPVPAQRVIEARAAYILDSILKDVIRVGTGVRALALNRSDIAGKTGTTNENKDAWFSGYNPSIAVSAWVGFDQPQTLGRREYGGQAALPIWIDYMRAALTGTPEIHLPQPAGMISVRIDPNTGLRATPGQQNAIFEIFRIEEAPREETRQPDGTSPYLEQDRVTAEQIF